MLRVVLTKSLRAKQSNKLICIQKARFSSSKLSKNTSTALKATTISDDASFAVAAAPFDYEEVIDIKREYFGRTLEQYKKKVEGDLVNNYISHVSPKEQKLLKQEAIEIEKKQKLIKRQSREAKLQEQELREQHKKDKAEDLKNIMTRQIPPLSEVFSSGAFEDALRENPEVLTNINIEEYGDDPKFKKSVLETFTTAEHPPALIIAAPHRQWEWEIHLPQQERMKLVHKDLVARGFTPNPLPRGVVLEKTDAEKLHDSVKEFLNGYDANVKAAENTNTADAKSSDKAATTGAADSAAEAAEAAPTVEEAAENDEFLRRFVDRPEDELEKDLDAALNQNAVVAEIAAKEKKFDPLANPFDASTPILTSPKPLHVKDRNISVPLVTDKNPFAWVTVDSPMIPETIKKTKLFRRATLLVKVSALKLPKMVRSRLLEIVGPRYDLDSDVLKITSTDHLEFIENRRYCLKLFQAALSDAWKADLNYVPPVQEPIYPHQQVIRELHQEQDLQKLKSEYGVEGVKNRASQYPYVIFRYNPHTVPSDELMQQRQALLMRLLQVFGFSSAQK
eukprot:TRINITY_DN1307_c0_g1_i1.p1 TRINITY_DN1307_c0_g1~~TRINITY_DN1307_c0_g1_i1.p1  ORF type:complete len:564 (-),score=180.31 TRINITY_DN1307_c0_g1_i1:39-1730(-)